MRHTKQDLKLMQSFPLDIKIRMTKERIKAWYENWVKYEIYNKETGKTRYITCQKIDSYDLETALGCSSEEYVEALYDGQVYVSFSGGKDSTVLLHIARQMYPNIEAVFVNTGLEYPEIQKFVKTFDNVTILRPKMRFDEVIREYGYPMISKEVAETVDQARKTLERNSGKETYKLKKLCGEAVDKNGEPSKYNIPKYKPLLYTDFKISASCCGVMKKAPIKEYEKKSGKKAIIATMAAEGRAREVAWFKTGCNAFESKRPLSKPLSFWTEQDILLYIKENNIKLADVYGEVTYKELPEQTRFEDFGIECGGAETLGTTGCDRTGCIFCAFGCHLEKDISRFQRLKENHPRQYRYCIEGGEYVNGVWQPNKDGLGMGKVFDEINSIYGEDFIKYK